MPHGTAIICPQCGQEAIKPTGTVNRSRAKSAPVYCGRVCAGIARRDQNPPTDEQRRAAKADYDRVYRAQPERMAKKRAAYHIAVAADPIGMRAREREMRKRMMPRHVEYCRSSEYRAYKKGYDQRYRARQDYGPFADAALTLLQLEQEIRSRSTWLDLQVAKGTLNKSKQRKRDYAKRSIGKTVRSQSEGGAMGYAEVDSEGAAPARRGRRDCRPGARNPAHSEGAASGGRAG